MHNPTRGTLAGLAALTCVALTAKTVPEGLSSEASGAASGSKPASTYEGRKRELRKEREEAKKREMQEMKTKKLERQAD
ncbi:hypothetical protein [Cupriavidus sp. amp6]|uniref:hypothetical protein n=1 Tax=Cupriavidus sp. amp6 TaxID=388051 RepID=UPI0012ECAB3E|nr:hypothetical protein [Cupriavidus sp. amp6]